MNDIRNLSPVSSRTLGALIIVQCTIGMLVNQVLLGPHSFGKDYLLAMSTNSFQVKIAMILGIVSGVISIIIASHLLPFFRQKNPILSSAYFAFAITSLTIIVIDNSATSFLLAVSKAFLDPGTGNSDSIKELGVIAKETRLWTHWMTILVPSLTAFMFYYLLGRTRMIPFWLGLSGLFGAVLMALAILMMIFEKGSFLVLMAPFGLVQIFLAFWLLFKGLNLRAYSQN